MDLSGWFPELVPARERARMQEVQRLAILDTPPDGAFDRITELAASLLRTPISIISIVDHDRIWFKSHHGVEASEIPRSPGLCASAILGDKPWVLTNAKTDPRSLANPLVAGEFGLQFYAGVPLRTQDGFNLGTLCIIDHTPRQVTEEEIAQLSDFAAIVMDELELALRGALLRKTCFSERSTTGSEPAGCREPVGDIESVCAGRGETLSRPEPASHPLHGTSSREVLQGTSG